MGQKVDPRGLRLLINRLWNSIWYSDKDFADKLLEDIKIKNFIKKYGEEKNAAISKVTIERFSDMININIHTARPAIIIGKRGAEIEELKSKIEKLTNNKKVSIKIVQIRKPELDAQLVAENIAEQIEKRVPYKRAMKQAIANAIRSGAKGIKIRCSGRLAGAEMARSETYKEGRIPLQTLRAYIDYGTATAVTTLGTIGIKVWIYLYDKSDPFNVENQ